MEETFVDVRGTRVQLMSAGDGPPLVFLHGAGGGNWLPGLARLAERFHVYAPVHPGFGRSDDRPDWDRIDDYVFHYLDFLETLGLDRVHLAGASLGGAGRMREVAILKALGATRRR